ALADLAHPAIARLLDGGETAEGWPYLVLEYIDGEPIDAHVRRVQPSLAERLRLFLAVCDGVAHAHRALIVHRDLKPGNILVDRAGNPKLLDFGIAKLLADEAAAGVTRTYDRVLTPQYAAPEQLLGQPVTTATDVYALGLLLYEMLVEERPYEVPAGTVEAVAQALQGPPVRRPSTAVGARFPGEPRRRRALAGDLDNIVLQALRKEPERRYPSVDALAADVRRHLADQPVVARPDRL